MPRGSALCWLVLGFLGLLTGGIFLMPASWGTVEYLNSSISLPLFSSPAPSLPESPIELPVTHLPTPEPLKAIYMTQCAAATPSLRQHLMGIARNTEINAIVVDLKDYSGTVVFSSETALSGGKGCQVKDFKDLVRLMHDEDIYVIGRLTVFQDPLYTVAHSDQAVQNVSTGEIWLDHKKLSFVDVGAKPFWDYIISLAREAYDLGVDEINFDYVRYPSDGSVGEASYPFSGDQIKSVVLESFFSYLHDQLADTEIVTSVDLFGLTTSVQSDLNIGQVLEKALPYFDYIAPMVYPSHYPVNFNGWPDPNAKPYDIVYYAMTEGIKRLEIAVPAYDRLKLRPWLQDFNYPVPYTPEMVKAQIQATYDAGLTSWMMWDPANRYTVSVFQLESSD